MSDKMTDSGVSSSESTLAIRLRNLIVVSVAAIFSVLIVLGLQTESSTASLSTLAKAAVPYEEATANDKPTFLEFYADWCTSCQAMAPDIEALETEYGDRVNFVMLNVDNPKWLPEISRYEVDGIPHFVFLNATGDAVAETIGEQPRTIVAQNLDALLVGEALPYARQTGQTSAFEPRMNSSSSADDPRRHGAQVQ
jgi:thiol-disulfide isomerase/thioredoxin